MTEIPKGARLTAMGTLLPVPEVAASLGELTARWAMLEFLLTQMFASLSNLNWDTASAVMYALNATSARLDVVRTVAGRLPKGDPKRAAALECVQAAIKLSGRRNALVHHMWTVDVASGDAYTIDYRAEKHPQKRRSKHTAHSLMQFCDEISAVFPKMVAASGVPLSPVAMADFKTAQTAERARKSKKI